MDKLQDFILIFKTHPLAMSLEDPKQTITTRFRPIVITKIEEKRLEPRGKQLLN